MHRFDRSELLLRGGFGDVFKSVWNGREVSVKRVHLENLLEKTEFHRENVLKHLDHPNVIKLLHTESNGDFRYWVLELCIAPLDQVFLPDEDPKKYRGPRLPSDFDVLSQLAKGLAYIHSQQIIHRDIKPSNVLISVDSNELNVTMKWSFTISEPLESMEGTMSWMAPELLQQVTDDRVPAKYGSERTLDGKNDKTNENRCTVKSDVFAEGLLFAYYLGKGVHPYGHLSSREIQSKIWNNTTPIVPTSIRNSEYGHIIEKMLTYDPAKRITSSDVVEQLRQVTEQQRIKERKLLSLCSEKSPDMEAINKLIREGVDVNCVEIGEKRQKQTPLFLLIKNRNHQVESTFVSSTAKRQLNEDYQLTDAVIANVNQSFIQTMRLFIEHGVQVNHTDEDGWNIFHYLCQYYHQDNLLEIVRLLIENGIDVKCQNNDGWNALHLLCRHYENENLIDIIQLLIQYGISINCQTSDNKNALSCLTLQRATPRNLTQNVTKVLIRYGICITKENVTHELAQLSEECTGDREYFTFMANEGITLGWHLNCESCKLIRAIEKNSRRCLQHHQKFSNTYIAFCMIVDKFIEEENSRQTLEDCYLDPTELIEWLRRRLQHCLESIEPCIQTIEEICQYLQHLTNSSMHFNCDKYEEYLRSMHLIAESIGAKETMNQIQWFYLLPFDYRLTYDNIFSFSYEDKEEFIQAKMEWDETLFSWTHKKGEKTIGEFLKDAANDNSLFIQTEFSHRCHGQE